MANTSYMPVAKKDQVAWCNQFVEVLRANPLDYGISAALFTQIDTINTNLQAAWALTDNAATRTGVTIEARDQLIKQMKALVSKLVSIIQGTPSVTPEMLRAAKLTVRSTAHTPAPVPPVPFLKVLNVSGRNVTIDICQAQGKRGKPSRVSSATILTATGPTCPMSMDGFTYLTATGKSTLTIPFPPSTTGDTVWITAFWTNTAKVAGPAADPKSVSLAAGGNLQAAEAEKPAKMKVAA